MGFSLGSLEDLNGRLEREKQRKVDSRNFRPNLVISGLPPFDEDCWLRVRAGQVEFVCYKPCMRSFFIYYLIQSDKIIIISGKGK